jgi:hypothetical protein
MARKKKKATEIEENESQVMLGANVEKFSICARTLNEVVIVNRAENAAPYVPFPGNIAPEGYFYSPFHEVTLKELEDEAEYIVVRRINFVPASASVETVQVDSYDPLTGKEAKKDVQVIVIEAPVPYSVILHQPFSIYDAMDEITYRGYLSGVNGTELTIETEAPIDRDGLIGNADPDRRSRYIISLLEENAPEYAEFIPSTQRLVWRAPKKMSELESTSPIYDMPFTNGRNYIQENINLFVRRQDPHDEFNLFRPSVENPLRRFQVQGESKIDFDQIRYITNTLKNAC